jgi:hypothetical protein
LKALSIRRSYHPAMYLVKEVLPPVGDVARAARNTSARCFRINLPAVPANTLVAA